MSDIDNTKKDSKLVIWIITTINCFETLSIEWNEIPK